jgi:hypothetical protein
MPNRLLTLPVEIYKEIYKRVFKHTLKELKYRTKNISHMLNSYVIILGVYDWSKAKVLNWKIKHKNPKSKKHYWDIL